MAQAGRRSGRAGCLSSAREIGRRPAGSDPSSPLSTGLPKGCHSEHSPEQPPQPEPSAPSPALPVPLFAAGAFARGSRDPASTSATRSAQQRHACYGAEAEPEEAPTAHRSLLLCPFWGPLSRASGEGARMTTWRAHDSSPHSYPEPRCSEKRASLRPSDGLRQAPARGAPLPWRLPSTSAADLKKGLTVPPRGVRHLRRPSKPRAAARRPARDYLDPRSS